MALCKLCKLDKPLIKRSHIIPDFIYKHSGLYDEKHRLRLFSVQDLVSGKQPSMPQSGVYEGDILCADCDNTVLGEKLEKYVGQVLYGGGKTEIDCNHYQDISSGQNFSICSNIDYSRFKLCLLSILWRASISSKSFFKDVDLAEHEEIVRKMIWDNNPGEIDQYPIFVVSIASDTQVSADVVLQPTHSVDRYGMTTYCFVLGGFVFIFKLGRFRGDLEELRTHTINKQNELAILQLRNGDGLRFIRNYAGLEN